eukprot:933727_1
MSAKQSGTAPVSAFAIFHADYEREHPTHKGTGQSQPKIDNVNLAAHKWSQLDSATRQKYQDKCDDAKKKYKKKSTDSKTSPSKKEDKRKTGSPKKYTAQSLTLPTGKVRALMTLDPDVARVTKEAAILTGHVTSMFLKWLVPRASKFAEYRYRGTLKASDIDSSIGTATQLEFLRAVSFRAHRSRSTPSLAPLSGTHTNPVDLDLSKSAADSKYPQQSKYFQTAPPAHSVEPASKRQRVTTITVAEKNDVAMKTLFGPGLKPGEYSGKPQVAGKSLGKSPVTQYQVAGSRTVIQQPSVIPQTMRQPVSQIMSQFPGYSRQIVPQPASGQIMRQSGGGQVIGRAASGQLIRQPMAGQVMRQPMAGQVMRQHVAGQVMQQPTSGHVMWQPMSGQVMRYPVSGQIMRQPAGGQAMQQPRSGEIVRQSATSEIMQQSAIAELVRQSSGGSVPPVVAGGQPKPQRVNPQIPRHPVTPQSTRPTAVSAGVQPLRSTQLSQGMPPPVLNIKHNQNAIPMRQNLARNLQGRQATVSPGLRRISRSPILQQPVPRSQTIRRSSASPDMRHLVSQLPLRQTVRRPPPGPPVVRQNMAASPSVQQPLTARVIIPGGHVSRVSQHNQQVSSQMSQTRQQQINVGLGQLQKQRPLGVTPAVQYSQPIQRLSEVPPPPPRITPKPVVQASQPSQQNAKSPANGREVIELD